MDTAGRAGSGGLYRAVDTDAPAFHHILRISEGFPHHLFKGLTPLVVVGHDLQGSSGTEALERLLYQGGDCLPAAMGGLDTMSPNVRPFSSLYRSLLRTRT